MKTKLTILAFFFITASYSQSLISVTPDTISAGGVSNTITVKGHNTFWNTGAGIYYVRLVRNNDTIIMFSLNIISDTVVECTFFVPDLAVNGCYDVQTFDLTANIVTLECGMNIIGGITGVEDKVINTNLIKVFPNPSINNISISFTEKSSCILTLLNTLGQVVFQSNYENIDFVTLNMDELKEGIYFLKLELEENTYIKKIIKK